MISPEELGVMAKAFLNRKEDVVMALLKDIEQCQTQTSGCSSALEQWDKVRDNPENLEKQLQTAVKCVGKLSDINRRLLMVLMVYISGDQFSTDTAHLMVKLGRGEEALQDLFKQKVGGG